MKLIPRDVLDLLTSSRYGTVNGFLRECVFSADGKGTYRFNSINQAAYSDHIIRSFKFLKSDEFSAFFSSFWRGADGRRSIAR